MATAAVLREHPATISPPTMSKKLTIRNIPESVHRRLKERAAQEGRSLNSEIVRVLEESVGTSIDEKRAAHERIRQKRKPIVSEDPAELKRTYREGLL